MKGIGKMIFRMALELKLVVMVGDMRGSIRQGKKMDRGLIYGRMALSIMGNGKIIKFMEMFINHFYFKIKGIYTWADGRVYLPFPCYFPLILNKN